MTDEKITDKDRLDWLERIMTPKDRYVEVYLAGLRNGDADASEYQFEANPHDPKWGLTTGKTLREAIDEAMTCYYAHDSNPLYPTRARTKEGQ